jgi:asparagine synthase (glutamine-hydrolysing)
MCGIAGFIDNKLDYDCENVLKNMVISLKHRGPDSQNYWKSYNQKILIGHSRLSIRDLSKRSNQPINSDDYRYVLSYNGEIYNTEDLKIFLKKNFSYSFSDNNVSDTIILLKLIELNGLEKSLILLDGMFAFFLLDQKKKKAFLVRDNFGQKPLYFIMKNNFFCFASELKALRKHPKINFRLNKYSINHFLNYSYISAPNTIYEDVFQLEPGSCLKLSYDELNYFDERKDFRKQHILNYKKWWSPKKENISIKKEGDNLNEYSNILFSSMDQFMQSDVSVGTFLSGGIDSALVTSICSKISKRKINTFTVGFNIKNYDETNIAKNVSNILSTNHHEVFLSDKEILETVESIPYVYDEPFADSSQIPTMFLSKFAKKNITVALTGDGGDEIFGGYNRYIYLPKLIKLLKFLRKPALKSLIKIYLNFPKIITQAINLVAENKKISQVEDKLIKLLKVIENSNNNSDIYYETLKTNNTNYFKNINLNQLTEFEFNNQLDLMYLDKINYLPNDILCKVDRATMHSSLESRAPFLSSKIVNFAENLSKDDLFKNNLGKNINRKVLSNFIPEKIFQVPKKGFGVPLNQWLKGSLRHWADYLFYDHSFSEDYNINNKHINDIWLKFKKDSKGNEKLIWNILILKAWDLRWNARN